MTEIRIDPRIEAYIAQAAPFAQPILRHLRALVHRALPGIEKTANGRCRTSCWAARMWPAWPLSRRLRVYDPR